MTITEAAKWLQERDNFLVIAHKRPDGDAIGSAAGLAKGLKLAGKTAYILPNPEMTKKFVPYVTEIDAPADFVPEYIVTVDTASEGMFQINASDYTDKADLAIDHHVSNTGYAKNVCVLPECAACGEIVYHILTEMGVQVDSETATLLYIAVSTDTGCFAYTNTVAETLETAGKLVAAGADSKSVNKIFFRTKSKNRMKFEGALLSGLDFCFDDKVAFMTVTLADREKYSVDDNDLDDIASIPNSIEGVCIGITVKELSENESKISVRSIDGYNANVLCAAFGGGGHPAAAGCAISAPVSEAKELLKKEIAKLWSM